MRCFRGREESPVRVIKPNLLGTAGPSHHPDLPQWYLPCDLNDRGSVYHDFPRNPRLGYRCRIVHARKVLPMVPST
jgi:hypothetical protein